MRALVYHGPGRKAWEEVPDPEITDDGDVIVQVDATTICGTDLHILKGDVPAVQPGRILGHEAVGTVWEAGDGVRRLCPGDRVLVSCISACGSCRYCREARYGQCTGFGGSPAADLETLRELLLRVSRLAGDLPEVTDLDLNPVMAKPNRVFAVDARIKVAPCPPQDPFLRKLR